MEVILHLCSALGRHIWRAGPILSSSAQEKHGHIEATLTEGHEYGMEIVVPFVQGEAERAVPVLPAKSTFWGRSLQCV